MEKLIATTQSKAIFLVWLYNWQKTHTIDFDFCSKVSYFSAYKTLQVLQAIGKVILYKDILILQSLMPGKIQSQGMAIWYYNCTK